MFKMCMLALVGVIFAMLLKGNKSEYSFLLILGLSTFLFSFVLQRLSEVMTQLDALKSFLGEYEPYLVLLLRITGITYVCQFCTNLCRDAGYVSISEQVEMMGKLWIMLMGLPVLFSVAAQIRSFW